MSKEFGDRLRSRRKECEMTTTACAAALGVTQPAWNQWELGVREPKLEMLSKIAKLLDVKVDWLLGLDERGTSVNAGAGAAVAIGANARASVRGTSAAPGEMPACSKCPYKKAADDLAAIAAKKGKGK